jgi:Ribosomal proteins 50S-L15, 50S-L18e, 60S-L27A
MILFFSSPTRSARDLEVLNLEKIQQFVDMGRLTPKSNAMITMRDLLSAGLVTQVKDGVKLLAQVSEGQAGLPYC